MQLDSFQLWLLIGGSLLTVLGGLVVFNDRFLKYLEQTWWKKGRADDAIFSDKGARIFNRYGTGLGCLILGIGLLVFFFQTLK